MDNTVHNDFGHVYAPAIVFFGRRSLNGSDTWRSFFNILKLSLIGPITAKNSDDTLKIRHRLQQQ